MDLTELARALEDALWKHTGKPIWPDKRNSPKCETPTAKVQSWNGGIAMKLHPMQGDADVLGVEEAKRYLAWLTAGNFGHPWYSENRFLNGEPG